MIRLVFVISLSLLMACSKKHEQAQLTISPTWQGQVINCDTTFNIQNGEWRIRDFSLYLSLIEYQDLVGQWHTVALDVGKESSSKVVLLTPQCSNNAKDYKWQIQTNNNIEQWQKVKFTLGIPFELNHENPIFQKSPLNVPSMFWVWRTGHKFLRLEMESENDSWLFHLGSVGCQAKSAIRAPEKPCQFPNTFSYEVNLLEDKQISLDVGVLLNGITLNTDNGCKSSRENSTCITLFDNLSSQSLFSTRGTK